LSHRSGN